jgi:hypothetical protein
MCFNTLNQSFLGLNCQYIRFSAGSRIPEQSGRYIPEGGYGWKESTPWSSPHEI